ncbi:hypothetical protein ACFQY0_13470 [Haloferula chungangensis]|uniref:Uncharacterized protein n=1 Tax=Haloferula chungangensis TaxID=1048331 RepID=A0ABW2L942_9BACT
MITKRRRATLVQFFFVTMVIALGLFGASYYLLDHISEASTGYNAKAKGIFSWLERYQEHDYDATGTWTLKAAGTRLNPMALTAEIGVCVLVGALVSAFSLALVPRALLEENKLGEQASDGDP